MSSRTSRIPQKTELIIDQPSFNQLQAVFDEPNGQKRSYLLVEILGKQQRICVRSDDSRRR